MFYAKDFHLMQMDFGNWFEQSYKFFRKTHPEFPTKFFLIDFTTVYNRSDYYDIMENLLGLKFLDQEIIDVKKRNLQSIPLHQTISFNLIDCNSPILYFVDTFLGLYNNDLWFRMRDITHDLAMDRNGNILPCTDIVQGKC
jgi:hypothetical protein